VPGEESFTFTNLTGRGPGPFVRALGTVLPGVAAVQAQVVPYAAAWREANLTALAGGRGARWVTLGDSMTQGIGASSPERGWVGQLSQRLAGQPAGREVHVVNLSQSGARVEDVIALQLPAWRALPPATEGEIVSVLIGSNDVFSPRHRNLLPEAFAELLAELPPGAVVSTLPSPARVAERVNAQLTEAARSGAIRLVSPGQLDPGAWSGRLAADRFHPNDTGYAMIAEMFEPAIREALSALPVHPTAGRPPVPHAGSSRRSAA
jgi:lysophospholipase L1-like esterase